MSVVIVALPTQDDRVHQISSEKVPHLTLLYLGEEVDNLQQVVQYVQHVAQTSLHRFGLSVDRRGVLGDDQADVLFFEHPGWQTKELTMVRSYLLTDPNIRKAYDSVQQYPKWTPHLTLGYPESPAHPDDRDYPGISWVSFDRIAVWTGDFEGPEFTLPVHSDADGEIAMHNAKLVGASFMEEMFGGHKLHHASDDEANRFIHALLGLEVDPESEEIFHFELDEDGDVVIHYGVKGMRWGHTKAESGSAGGTSVKKERGKIRRGITKANTANKASNEVLNEGRNQLLFLPQKQREALTGHMSAAALGAAKEINKRPEFKGRDLKRDPELKAQYHAEVKKAMKIVYKDALRDARVDAALDAVDAVLDARRKHIQMKADLGLQHAESTPQSGIISLALEFDEDEFGQISDIRLADDFLEHGLILDDDSGNYLLHYGKKGMKWGVRNDKGHEGEQVKTKKLDKLDKKWEKENSGVKAMIKAHNAAADKMNNGEIDRVNNKPEHAKASKEGKFDNWEKPTPELEAYWKDMDDTFNTHFNNALVNLGSNPSGTKRYQITVDEDGNPYAELSEIKHASVGDIDVRYKITLDSRGMIAAYTMEETELKHYGVKGMRWGHRKSEGSSAVDPTQITVTQKKPGTFVKATGGKALPASEEAKRAAELKQKARKSTTDALSNKELQELVQRMNLEKQYRQAMFEDDRRSIGKKFIDGLFGQKRYGGEKRRFTDDWEELGESFRSKPEPEEKDTKKK